MRVEVKVALLADAETEAPGSCAMTVISCIPHETASHLRWGIVAYAGSFVCRFMQYLFEYYTQPSDWYSVVTHAS